MKLLHSIQPYKTDIVVILPHTKFGSAIGVRVIGDSHTGHTVQHIEQRFSLEIVAHPSLSDWQTSSD